MRVRILHTCAGSENGVTIRFYHEGQVREIDDDLARIFIEAGTAEPVDREPLHTCEMKEPLHEGESVPLTRSRRKTPHK